MGLFKPDPPTPPNPYQTAAAATGTNVSTAIANTMLNQVNQETPDGYLAYNTVGNYNWTDPTTGDNYQIPLRTATQQLSSSQQQIKNQQDQAKLQMSVLGNTQASRLGSILGTNLDVAGAPSRGDPSTIRNAPKAQTGFNTGPAVQTGLGPYGEQRLTFGGAGQQQTTFDPAGQQQTAFGGAGQQQTTFGNAGDITRGYGPADNFSADRQRVEDSLMARMNPQLDRERSNIEQRLADQGIRYGSQAYTSAMDDYNRQANDARFAAVGQAGSEQQRMNQMEAQLAAFKNSAQGQAFGQEQSRGQFANEAQQRDYAQAQGRGQFANEAQQRAYEQAQGRGAFANEAQQRDYEQALGRGTFVNEAQQRMYDQSVGAGSFYNAAQGQQFGQNATAASFYNAGAAQQMGQAQSAFNADQTARNQYMQEQYALRNQPLNEISSLMSGSQISTPNWLNTPGSQIATTDVGGLINQNFQNQMGIYNSQMQNANSTMGGILGLGGKLGAAAITASDERVKENIVPLGSVFTATEDGDRKKLPISEWSYKGDPARHVGPMAQDVEKVDRGAVVEIGGVKHIDRRRVMGNILKAA